ncbi:hypothetical protein FB451DRAFT_1390422 [Mycena latifolia]|nr:hypothetical protein FB451DRAFT_1390422 [Mycena latifolia]
MISRRPLAPALRELELQMKDKDLERILKIGFCDVVVDTLTGSIYNGDSNNIELLAGALLLGVGLLRVFECLYFQEVELRDDDGHIRHLRCWNEDSNFEVQDVWRHLSIHYDLHQTVREIRITAAYWDDYLAIFELYPPSEDDITLALNIGWDNVQGDSEQMQTTQKMCIAGLSKVEFSVDRHVSLTLKSIVNVLACIKPPGAQQVEICTGNEGFTMGDSHPPPLSDLKSTLAEVPGNWTACGHFLILNEKVMVN